jgi:ABC-type sugar transport system ATPase subunit
MDSERWAILGPSGSGKTTLLRLIAGLERADVGTVHMKGRLLNNCLPKERGVSLLFQNSTLLPHLDVREHLELPVRLARGSLADAESRIQGLADAFELGPILHRRPADLSAGEKHRVELARCLVRQPAVWLLDEPTSHLDAPLRRRSRQIILEQSRSAGVPILLVTHDVQDAEALAERVLILDGGRVVQMGTLEELRARPASSVVRELLAL